MFVAVVVISLFFNVAAVFLLSVRLTETEDGDFLGYWNLKTAIFPFLLLLFHLKEEKKEKTEEARLTS